MRVGSHEAVGRVTAEPVWATRSSPPSTRPRWTASPCGPPTPSARARARPSLLEPGAYDVVDTGDPLPDGRDAVVMREHVHRDDDGGAELRGGGAALPARAHDRRGRQRRPSCCCPRATGCGPVDVAAAAAAGAVELRRAPRARVVAVLPTGDEIRPVGAEPAPGEILDTNSLMLAAQAERPAARRGALPIVPDDPDAIAAAVRDAAAARATS